MSDPYYPYVLNAEGQLVDAPVNLIAPTCVPCRQISVPAQTIFTEEPPRAACPTPVDPCSGVPLPVCASCS